MNRILQAEVILTLTREQAECLVEMCHFVVGRVEQVAGVLDGSQIGHATGVVFVQCARQGVTV